MKIIERRRRFVPVFDHIQYSRKIVIRRPLRLRSPLLTGAASKQY